MTAFSVQPAVTYLHAHLRKLGTWSIALLASSFCNRCRLYFELVYTKTTIFEYSQQLPHVNISK